MSAYKLAPFFLSLGILGQNLLAEDDELKLDDEAAAPAPIAAAAIDARPGQIIAIFDLANVSGEILAEPGLGEVMSGEAFSDKRMSFFTLLSRIRACKDDTRVKSVVIYPKGASLGNAQMTELGRRLEELRAAGKDVVTWSDGISGGQLTLAAAGRLVLMPDAEVEYAGIVAENLHFKGLLDKLGVQFDVIHCGDYKSAFENFYLDAPSAPARRQSEALYGSLFGLSAESLAARRQLSWPEMQDLVSTGLFSAKDAVNRKLADGLASHQDFVADMKKRFPGARIVKDYGAPKKTELKLDNLTDILGFMGQLGKAKPADPRPALALVILNGEINDEMGEPLRAHLVRCAADPAIRGMVLRIDSPGGSALASEAICSGTASFKAAGKPFVVSMGNVAASGGYYAAVYGSPVYAESTTITGSIGVVGGKPVFKGLMDKIGVTSHSWKLGDRADLMSLEKPFAAGDKEFLLGVFDRIYGRFKERVLDGRRGKIAPENIESLAGGRVYTGAQALELGLVDKLGGLREAINDASAQCAFAGDWRVDLFPRQSSLMEKLLKGPDPRDLDEAWLSADARKLLAAQPGMLREFQLLKNVNPELARKLATALGQAALMAKGEALLVAPPCVL
ncbi:MAG: hypothetical protein RL095_4002 [Verrucomicrobiota bacterium]|jgi:protease-4